MFRKPTAKRKLNVRRKEEERESEEDDDEVVRKAVDKRVRKNPMVQSTKSRIRKEGEEDISSSDSDGQVNDEFAFKASGSDIPLGPKDQGATATLDIDTEIDKDAQSQFERVQEKLAAEGMLPETDQEGRRLYRGIAMYGARKAEDTSKGKASSGMNRVGPVRAPQFLRQTVRWDFAPDICKDYKETGFCTFGDSCKFMHDRGDYKHGWELERDFEQGQQEPEQNYEISDDEDEFPSTCSICEGAFRSPVVTRCKHYFCESCAITAFAKSKKCRVCEQNTGGVFNVAKDLIAHLNKANQVKEEDDDDELDDVKDMKMEEGEGEEEEGEVKGSTKVKEEVEEEEGEEKGGDEEERDDEGEEEGILIEGGGEEEAITNEVEGNESAEDGVSDEEEYEEGQDVK